MAEAEPTQIASWQMHGWVLPPNKPLAEAADGVLFEIANRPHLLVPVEQSFS